MATALHLEPATGPCGWPHWPDADDWQCLPCASRAKGSTLARGSDSPCLRCDDDHQPCATCPAHLRWEEAARGPEPEPRACTTCVDAAWLVETGTPPRWVHTRLGITHDSLQRHLYRHDTHVPRHHHPETRMTVVQLRVVGQPAPQGSKNAFVDRRTGRARMRESSATRVKAWRAAVLVAALRHRRPGVACEFPDGPVHLEVTFLLPRPLSHHRGGKRTNPLRDDAPTWVTTSPDLDKELRATGDGITDARIWADDRQVAAINARKVYADPGEHPGARITITDLTNPPHQEWGHHT